jgi:hypothetical protein
MHYVTSDAMLSLMRAAVCCAPLSQGDQGVSVHTAGAYGMAYG